MIEQIFVVGLLGLAFGLGLTYAGKKLAAREDDRVERISKLLPGQNCGACGFGGCRDFASALVSAIDEGETPPLDACKVVAEEARGEIAGILGIEVGERKPLVAQVACSGKSKRIAEYRGARECAAADLVGDFLACEYGCIGFGDCARACSFGAIEMKDGLPVIDRDKCTGCGACVEACPRGVIELIPRDSKVWLRCRSPEPGKVVVVACEAGCIACGLCAKACPVAAIKIENNLPRIDQDLCTGCGKCVEACPRDVLSLLSSSEAS
ncbi:MAG: RnfABCDGE type electron transport complex subunit B [Hadesarchaea archaeon]|nr:RnfABCDGE type electron transport complex subunit B [Hadesarchaea archaeon]